MIFPRLILFVLLASTISAPADKPWSRHTIDDSSQGADGVRLADVNGDGLMDIAVGWEEGGVVRAYLHPGRGAEKKKWPAVTVGKVKSAEDAVFADLDRDGAVDVVSSCEGRTKTMFVHWAPQGEDAYLQEEQWKTEAIPATAGKQAWMYALPMQVDGEHGIDLVASSKGGGGSVGWLQAPQNGRDLAKWKWHKLQDAGWIMSLIAADMDGDGDDDVLVSDRKGAKRGIYWLEYPGAEAARMGAEWVRHEIGGSNREILFLSRGDLDQDGKLDVIAIEKKAVVWFRADGREWSEHVIPLPAGVGGGKSAAVGDFDGDGHNDVVFSCEGAKGALSGTRWLSWTRSPFKGPWISHEIAGAPGLKYDRVVLHDVDGDGDLDVLCCEERDQLGVFWYENPFGAKARGVRGENGARGKAAATRKPNVLFILADDLGYADIGVHGCEDIPTPHIDSLAARGVRCTSGYSSHPFCSPMRAGLMAGRYQHRFGYENNIAYDPQNKSLGFPRDEKTVAERLKEAGYVTGAIGKWHLGAAHHFHPNMRGFEHFFGFLGGGHDYFLVSNHKPMGEGYFSPLERNGEPMGPQGYLTDALSDEAVRFIDENKAEPFFLYLAYNAPHGPLQAPEERLAKFAAIKEKKRRTYAAMVNAMDDGIGRVLAALDENQLRRDTLVFFLSDNGGPTKANASSNKPLRGFKGDVYEGGIRVPFLASWPGTLPEGTTYEHPVISFDVTCTAVALASADGRIPDPLEGVNLVPYLKGENANPPHPALFWRKGGGVSWAVRSGDQKLLQAGEGELPEMYSLRDDIAESSDGVSAKPERAKELRQLFDAWNSANKRPAFPGYRDYHQLKNRFYRELPAEPGVN